MDMPSAAGSVTTRHDVPVQDQSRMNGMEAARQQRFWRRVSFWTAFGLCCWLALTFAVVWLARDLDRWTIAQVPAGYWWAAQGAIGGFLVIIVVYCVVMERLEAQFLGGGRDEDPAFGFPDAAVSPAQPGRGAGHG